jgi:hypothetical protein
MRRSSLIVFAAVVAVVAPDAGAVRALERAALRVGGEAVLTVPGAASATPSIAAAGRRVAVAWGARVPGGATDVYVAMSADGGRTFGAPVRVNDRAGTARLGGELPPRVAITADVVTVVWTARAEATSIRIARSEDAGRTFGPSRELQRRGAAGDRGWPALAADAKGRVHAIWLDHRGMAPEPPPTGAHHGHDRSAAAAADGAAMAQKSGLFYSDLTGERELTRGVCYCCKTALAAAGDGAIFAAWRHVYPGNIRDIAFTMSRDGGRSFAPPVRVSEDGWQLEGCPDDGPALAVDARRTVHIVWPTVTAAPEPHKAIFYASTIDGRAFAPRVRVSPLGHNTAHPQIALDGAGMVWALWDEIVSARRRVFVAARQEDGAFEAPRALSGDAASASYPVAAAADGALVAAWVAGEPSVSRIEVRRLASPRSSAAPQVPPR